MPENETEIAEQKLKDKIKRINDEIERLSKQFTKIPAKIKKAVSSLISNAAFMTITLEDLRETINADGGISKYKNGENQWGTKKSPEVEIYNTMVKNLASVIKQLTDYIPEGGGGSSGKQKPDEFEKIANRRGKSG